MDSDICSCLTSLVHSFIIKPSPVNSKKMFMTRGGSVRSKSPQKHRKHKRDSGGGGGGGGCSGNELKAPELDGVSMLSNSASIIAPSSHKSDSKRDSQSSSSSVASLPSDDKSNHSDHSPSTVSARSPRLGKLKGKENFLSLDGNVFGHAKRSKKSKHRSSKGQKDILSPDRSSRHLAQVFRSAPLMENDGDQGGEDENHEFRGRNSGMDSKHVIVHNEDDNDSGSSGDIVLPAITVPRNYDPNAVIVNHNSNSGTGSSCNNSAQSSDLQLPVLKCDNDENIQVKICIDSPSEEELSYGNHGNFF